MTYQYPPNANDLSNVNDLCYPIIVFIALLIAFLIGSLFSDHRTEKKLEKLIETDRVRIDAQNHKTR